MALVEQGEGKTLEGWIAYGAALNEGRDQFPKGDNKRFSEWLANANLAEVAVTGTMVRAILAAIRRLRAPPLCA